MERMALISALLADESLTRAERVGRFLDVFGWIRVKELREDFHISNPAKVIYDLRHEKGLNIVNEKRQVGGFMVNTYRLARKETQLLMF